MATYEEAQRYCNRCRTHVLVRRSGTQHMMHLVVSLITCGAWVPFWILASLRFGGWRCVWCGTLMPTTLNDVIALTLATLLVIGMLIVGITVLLSFLS